MSHELDTVAFHRDNVSQAESVLEDACGVLDYWISEALRKGASVAEVADASGEGEDYVERIRASSGPPALGDYVHARDYRERWVPTDRVSLIPSMKRSR